MLLLPAQGAGLIFSRMLHGQGVCLRCHADLSQLLERIFAELRTVTKAQPFYILHDAAKAQLTGIAHDRRLSELYESVGGAQQQCVVM